MNQEDNWVDVRKKQIREANDVSITIKQLKDLNCYFTVKTINSIDENSEFIKNRVDYPLKVNKNYKMLEYTPINEDYNVRVYVDDKNEIFQYYLDIIDGVELRNGVPFYKDMYLDIIYYNKPDKILPNSRNSSLYMCDEDELKEALENKKITQFQYDKAFKVADKLMKEIKDGSNIYINRGLNDYLKNVK